MADYRDYYSDIRASGYGVVALSVDSEKTSEVLRRALRLPFPLLCDTEHRVVKQWDLYNAQEKGGIAKPAAFVIERDRTVRYATVDSVAARVSASEMLRLLQAKPDTRLVRRKLHVPRLNDWVRGMRNLMQR